MSDAPYIVHEVIGNKVRNSADNNVYFDILRSMLDYKDPYSDHLYVQADMLAVSSTRFLIRMYAKRKEFYGARLVVNNRSYFVLDIDKYHI